MVRCHRQLLAALSFLVAAGVSSQANADNFPGGLSAPFLARSWQTEQGLPHNMVLAITQTRDGYLWLGTAQGLARFDGVNCRVFGLQDGLKGLEISALLEDSGGALWIGTVSGGLNRYFHGVMETFAAKDGLNSEAITALLEDKDGGIWIGTTAGLYRRQNGRFNPMAGHLDSIFVRALAEDRQGAVWVSTLHNGLMCFQNGKLVNVPEPPEMRTISACYLLVDNQGRLWAGLWGGAQMGVVLCRENGKWIKYGPADGLPEVYINSLAQTSDGTIWGGTLDEGLFYFKDGKFNSLRMKDGLSDDAICTLFVDRQQNLWIGTRSGGLNRVSPRKLSVCRVLENSSERLPISLAQTTNGELWVAASGRGIYQWSGGTFNQLLRTLPTAGHMFVGALLGARDGSLWWGAGPALFQWKDGEILSDYEREPWLRGDRVLSLCENSGGGMWVGTYNGQLQLLQQGRFTPVAGLPEKPVTALAQEPDGTLWIGSMGGGLARLQKGKLSVFTTRDGLRSDLIRALHIDTGGTLWIGTVSGGLGRWSQGRLTSFTSQQGLIDDTILQILEDDGGDLWLGCNRGICRVSKKSLDDLAEGKTVSMHLLAFGNPEGMISEQCEANFASGLKTRDGQLLFCTAKGIVIIDPRQQTNSAVEPAVLMEDILVDGHAKNELFQVPDKTGHAATPAIPAGNHSFEFHYTGLNFSAPENIRFRYRLEGLDADWVEADAGRAARYPYVPPGRYRFQVTACNNDGRWNPIGAEVSFVVLPHFWQTAWFEAVLVLALLGLTGGGMRYLERRRYRARLKRLQAERHMELERARIARDLHDELGSSLTRISMLSDLGQSRDNSTEQLKARVEKISNFAVRTARSLDEIVWAVNPRNDSLRSLLEYLIQFARELFEDTNIHCRFHIPEDLPRSPLLPEMRHNIFLAVKEALTNALKHAHATEVLLRAQIVGGQIEISIQDNGAGFDPASIGAATARSGLKNMRQRIESLGGQFAIQTVPGKSTTIIIMLQRPAEPTEPAGKPD
jgi:ligand-binding sensor domain-containing protein/signal transduction histidine kinase